MGADAIELQEIHHDTPPPASPATQHKQDLVSTNLVKATDVDGAKLRADLGGAMTELGIDESVQNAFQAAFSDVQLKDDFTTLSEEGVTKSIGHGEGSVEVTVRTRLVGDESPVAGPTTDEPKHEVENASGDYGKSSDENASTVRREKGADLTGMFGLGTRIPMGAVEANANVKASAVPGWKFGTDSALQHSSKVELPGGTRSTRHDLWHEITVTRHDGVSATRHGTQESGIEVTIPESLRAEADTTPVADTQAPHPQHVHSAHLRGDNGIFDEITKALPDNHPLRRELDTVGSTARGQLRETVSGSGLSLRASDLLGGREVTKTLEYEHLGQTRTATVHIGAAPHSPTLIHEQEATVTDSGGAKTEHAASEMTKQSTDVRFGGGGLVAIPRMQDASFAVGARGDVNVQAKVGGAGSDEHTMKNTTGAALKSEHADTGTLRAYRTTLDYDVRIDFDNGSSLEVGAHQVEAGATVWMSPEHAAANGWDSTSQQPEPSGSTPAHSDTPTPLSGISPLSVLGGKVEFGGVDRVATELHQILDGDVLPPHHGTGHQAPHVSKNVDRINALITPDSFAAHAAELVGDGWSFVLPRDTHIGTSTGTEHVWVKIRATPGRYEATPVSVPGGGELKSTLTSSSHDEHTTKIKGNWIGTGGFGGVIPIDPNFPLRTAQFSGTYTRKIGDFERTVTVTAGHENASSWKTGTHYRNTQRVHYNIEVFGPNGRIGERSFAADATAEVPVGSHPLGGQAGETPPAPTAEFRDRYGSTPTQPGGWKQAALPDDYAVHSLNLPHGMGEKLMLEIKAFDGLGDDAATGNPLGHLGKDGVIAANRVHNFAGPTEAGANLDRAVTGTYHAQVERYRQGELLTGYSDSLGEAAMHLSLSNPKVIDHAESLGLDLTTKSKGSTGHGEITKASSDTALDGRTNARLNQQGTMVPQGTHTATDESGAGTAHAHEHESSQKRAYDGPGYLVSFDASIVLSGRNTEHLVVPVGDIYSKSEWTHSQVDAHDVVRLWVPADQIHQIAGRNDVEWHVDHPHDETTTHYQGGQFAEPDHAKMADGWVNVRPEVTHNLLSHLEDALGSVTRDQLPDSVCESYVKWLYHSVTHMASSTYSWLMDPSAGRLNAMVHSRLFPALAPSGLGALYSDIVGGGIRTTYHYDGPLGRTDITITVKGTEKPGRVEAVSDKWTLSEESKTTSKVVGQRMTATTRTFQGQAVFSIFPEGQIQQNPGTAGAGEASHKSQTTVEGTKSTETTHTSKHTGRTVAFVHDLDLTISIEKTSGWGRLPQSLSFGVLDRFFPATTSEPVNVHASIKDAVRRLVPETDAQPLEQLQNAVTSGVDWAAPKHELPQGSRGTVRVDRVRTEIDSLLDGGLNAATEGRPAPSLPAGATGTRHQISAMTTQSTLSSQLKSAMSEQGYRIGGLDEDRYFEAGALNHGPIKSLTLHAELRNPRITAVGAEGSSFEGKQTSSETLKATHQKTLEGGTATRVGLGGLLWNSNPSGPGPGEIGRLAGELSIKGPAAEKVVTDTSEVGGKTFEQEHSSSGKTYLVSSDVSWSITPEYRGANVPGHWSEPRVVREPGGAVFRTDEAGLRSLGLEPPEDHSPAHEQTAPVDHSGTEQEPVEQGDLVDESTAHQQQSVAESSSAAAKSESMSDFLAPERESGGSTGGHGPEQSMSEKRWGKLPWNQVHGGDGHGLGDDAASGSGGHGSESSQHSDQEDAAHATGSGVDHESQRRVDQEPGLDADRAELPDVQSVPESQHQGVNWDLIVEEDRVRGFVLTEPGTPVYRTVNDNPEEVLQHGLSPRDVKDVRSLEFHVTTTGRTQFVATSSDATYRHNQRRYTYEIVSSEPGIDVLATFKKWEVRHPFPWEKEVAFPGTIPPKDIKKITDHETGEIVYRAPEPPDGVEQPHPDAQNVDQSVVDDSQSSSDTAGSAGHGGEGQALQFGNVVDAEARAVVDAEVRAYVDERRRAGAVFIVDQSQLPQWVDRIADALTRGDQAAADGIRGELHGALRGRRRAPEAPHENALSGLPGGSQFDAPTHVPGEAGPSGSQGTAMAEAGGSSGSGTESSSGGAFGATEHTETVPGTDHTITTTLDGNGADEYVLRDGDGTVLAQRFNLFDQGDNIGFVVVDHRDEQPMAHFFEEEGGDSTELEYSEHTDGPTRSFQLTDPDTGDFQEYDHQTHAVVRQSFGLGGEDRFGRVWHEVGSGRVLITDGLGRAHFGSGVHDETGFLHVTLPDGTFVVDPAGGEVAQQHVNPAVHLGHHHDVGTPAWAVDHGIDYEPAERWREPNASDDGRLMQLSADGRWWRLFDSEGNVTIAQAVRPGEQSQLVGKLTRVVKAWHADGTPLVIEPRYEWYRVDLASREAPNGVRLDSSGVGEVLPVEAHEPTANPDFDPLQAAVHRPTNLSALIPEPLWRVDSDLLHRFDSREFEDIFEERFVPLDPDNQWPLGGGRSTDVDLVTFTHQNPLSMYVSTTRSEGMEGHERLRYGIDAPGGLDVNRTLGPANRYPGEREISFPGGIKRRYIMGAEDPTEPDWYMVNKHYDPLGTALPDSASDVDTLTGMTQGLALGDENPPPATGIEAWERYVRARAEVARWSQDPAWHEVGESSTGSVAKQRAQQSLEAARVALREAEQGLRSLGYHDPAAIFAEQRARQAEERAGRDAAGHPAGGAEWQPQDQRFDVQTDPGTGMTLTTTLHGRQAGEFAFRDAYGVVVQQRMNLLGSSQESLGHVILDRGPGMNEATRYLPDGTSRSMRWEPVSEREFQLVDPSSGDYLRFDAPTRTLVEQGSGLVVDEPQSGDSWIPQQQAAGASEVAESGFVESSAGLDVLPESAFGWVSWQEPLPLPDGRSVVRFSADGSLAELLHRDGTYEVVSSDSGELLARGVHDGVLTGQLLELAVVPEVGGVVWQEPLPLPDGRVTRYSGDGALAELVNRDGTYELVDADTGVVVATGRHGEGLAGWLFAQAQSLFVDQGHQGGMELVTPGRGVEHIGDPAVGESGTPEGHGGLGGSEALRDWVGSAGWGDLVGELKASKARRSDVLGDPGARRKLAERLKIAYESDEKRSLRKLAEDTGYSRSTVDSLLKEAGAAQRPHLGDRRVGPRLAERVGSAGWGDLVGELKASKARRSDVLGDPEARRKLAERLKIAYESDEKPSLRKLAEDTGYSRSTVDSLLKEAGAAQRPHLGDRRVGPRLAERVGSAGWGDLVGELKASKARRSDVLGDPEARRKLAERLKIAYESDEKRSFAKLTGDTGYSLSTVRKLLREAEKRSREGVAGSSSGAGTSAGEGSSGSSWVVKGKWRAGDVPPEVGRALEIAREMNLQYGGTDPRLVAEHEGNLIALAARLAQGGEDAARAFVRELRGSQENPNPLYGDWATRGRGFGGARSDDVPMFGAGEAGPSGSLDTAMAEAGGSPEPTWSTDPMDVEPIPEAQERGGDADDLELQNEVARRLGVNPEDLSVFEDDVEMVRAAEAEELRDTSASPAEAREQAVRGRLEPFALRPADLPWFTGLVDELGGRNLSDFSRWLQREGIDPQQLRDGGPRAGHDAVLRWTLHATAEDFQKLAGRHQNVESVLELSTRLGLGAADEALLTDYFKSQGPVEADLRATAERTGLPEAHLFQVALRLNVDPASLGAARSVIERIGHGLSPDAATHQVRTRLGHLELTPADLSTLDEHWFNALSPDLLDLLSDADLGVLDIGWMSQAGLRPADLDADPALGQRILHRLNEEWRDARDAALNIGPDRRALLREPWFNADALMDLARQVDEQFATPEIAGLVTYCQHLGRVPTELPRLAEEWEVPVQDLYSLAQYLRLDPGELREYAVTGTFRDQLTEQFEQFGLSADEDGRAFSVRMHRLSVGPQEWEDLGWFLERRDHIELSEDTGLPALDDIDDFSDEELTGLVREWRDSTREVREAWADPAFRNDVADLLYVSPDVLDLLDPHTWTEYGGPWAGASAEPRALADTVSEGLADYGVEPGDLPWFRGILTRLAPHHLVDFNGYLGRSGVDLPGLRAEGPNAGRNAVARWRLGSGWDEAFPNEANPVTLAQFAGRAGLDEQQRLDFVQEVRNFGGFPPIVESLSKKWQVGPGLVYRVADALGVSPMQLRLDLPWLGQSASPHPEQVAAHAVRSWMRQFGFQPEDLALFGSLRRVGPVGPGELANFRDFVEQHGTSPTDLRAEDARQLAGEWRRSLAQPDAWIDGAGNAEPTWWSGLKKDLDWFESSDAARLESLVTQPELTELHGKSYDPRPDLVALTRKLGRIPDEMPQLARNTRGEASILLRPGDPQSARSVEVKAATLLRAAAALGVEPVHLTTLFRHDLIAFENPRGGHQVWIDAMANRLRQLGLTSPAAWADFAHVVDGLEHNGWRDHQRLQRFLENDGKSLQDLYAATDEVRAAVLAAYKGADELDVQPEASLPHAERSDVGDDDTVLTEGFESMSVDDAEAGALHVLAEAAAPHVGDDGLTPSQDFESMSVDEGEAVPELADSQPEPGDGEDAPAYAEHDPELPRYAGLDRDLVDPVLHEMILAELGSTAHPVHEPIAAKAAVLDAADKLGVYPLHLRPFLRGFVGPDAPDQFDGFVSSLRDAAALLGAESDADRAWLFQFIDNSAVTDYGPTRLGPLQVLNGLVMAENRFGVTLRELRGMDEVAQLERWDDMVGVLEHEDNDLRAFDAMPPGGQELRDHVHSWVSSTLSIEAADYRQVFGAGGAEALARLGSRIGMGPRSIELISYAASIGRVPGEIPDLARRLGLPEADGATLVRAAHTLGMRNPEHLLVFGTDLANQARAGNPLNVNEWVQGLHESLVRSGLPTTPDGSRVLVPVVAERAHSLDVRMEEFGDLDQFLRARGSSLGQWASAQPQDAAHAVKQWRAERLGISPERFTQLSRTAGFDHRALVDVADRLGLGDDRALLVERSAKTGLPPGEFADLARRQRLDPRTVLRSWAADRLGITSGLQDSPGVDLGALVGFANLADLPRVGADGDVFTTADLVEMSTLLGRVPHELIYRIAQPGADPQAGLQEAKQWLAGWRGEEDPRGRVLAGYQPISFDRMQYQNLWPAGEWNAHLQRGSALVSAALRWGPTADISPMHLLEQVTELAALDDAVQGWLNEVWPNFEEELTEGRPRAAAVAAVINTALHRLPLYAGGEVHQAIPEMHDGLVPGKVIEHQGFAFATAPGQPAGGVHIAYRPAPGSLWRSARAIPGQRELTVGFPLGTRFRVVSVDHVPDPGGNAPSTRIVMEEYHGDGPGDTPPSGPPKRSADDEPDPAPKRPKHDDESVRTTDRWQDPNANDPVESGNNLPAHASRVEIGGFDAQWRETLHEEFGREVMAEEYRAWQEYAGTRAERDWHAANPDRSAAGGSRSAPEVLRRAEEAEAQLADAQARLDSAEARLREFGADPDELHDRYLRDRAEYYARRGRAPGGSSAWVGHSPKRWVSQAWTGSTLFSSGLASHADSLPGASSDADPHIEAKREAGVPSGGGVHEAALNSLVDLGLDAQRVAEVRAQFEELATTGHLENHSLDIAANQGVREALRVIDANLDRIPEPSRGRLRSWVADAVLAASLVAVRESAPDSLAGLDHAAVQRRSAVRVLTPNRTESVLVEIAKSLKSWIDPFDAAWSALEHSGYRPDDGLPQRLVQLSLVNLTPQARLQLRGDALFQRLLSREDALVESMFASGGHDEQRFLATCLASVANTEVLGKVPTTAGLLLVGRNLVSQVRALIDNPPAKWAGVLDERDQIFGRTIRELVSDRLDEATEVFDDIDRRGLELIDSGSRDPDAWAELSQQWGRTMQKLSVVVDPSQGPDSVPVLTNKLIGGHWGWSAGVSALLMVLDRPFRRFASVDNIGFSKALQTTLVDEGLQRREVEFTRWSDESGAAECWRRVHRNGGSTLTTATHAIWLEAVQRDGQQAFLVHDPKKSHPDHYSPAGMLEWARRNKFTMDLVDPPDRPFRDEVPTKETQQQTDPSVSTSDSRSTADESMESDTSSWESSQHAAESPEPPEISDDSPEPQVSVAEELAAFGLDERRFEQARAELGEWAGYGRVEDYTADVLSQPELGRALREIRTNLDSVPGLDVARLKSLVADAVLSAALVPVRDAVISDSTDHETTTRHERLAAQPLSPHGLQKLLDNIASLTGQGKDPFRARESLLRHSGYEPEQGPSRRLTQLSLVNLSPHLRQQLVHDGLFQRLLDNEEALGNALFGTDGHDWRDLLAEHGLQAGTMPTIGGLLQVGRAVVRHLDDQLTALVVEVSRTGAGRGGSAVDEFVRRHLTQAQEAFDEIEQMAQDSFDSIEQTALAFIQTEIDGTPVHHEQWAELTRAWTTTMRAMLMWDGPALDGLRAALSDATTTNGMHEQVRVTSETEPGPLWERVLRAGGAAQATIGAEPQPVLVQAIRRDGTRLFTVADPDSGHLQRLDLDAFAHWAHIADAVLTVPAEHHQQTNVLAPSDGETSASGEDSDSGYRADDSAESTSESESGRSASIGEDSDSAAPKADDDQDMAPEEIGGEEQHPRSMLDRIAAPASWTTTEYRRFGSAADADTVAQRLEHGPFAYRAQQQLTDGGDQSFPRFLAARPVVVDEHPPLRISGDGTLAIAAHGHGAKESYATLEVVRRAQADLDRVGGAVRLRVDENTGIEFKAGGKTQRLYRVVPDFGDGGASDISKEFTRDVLGASPTHAVLYDTRPPGAGGTGKLATAKINTASDKEISGTHQLADALVSTTSELADAEWAAGQVRRGWDEQEHDSPTPGESYGRAFSRTGGGGSVAAKLGINEHARPQVGEGYLIQPISHGTNNDGSRRFSLDFSSDSDEGRRVERMRFYRFAPVVLESADGQHHIVLENTRRREADNRFLRTVLEENLAHYETRTDELKGVLDEEKTNGRTGSSRAVFAGSLLKVIEHREQFTGPDDEAPEPVKGELAAAKGNAVRALVALSGEEFGTSGDQWWFEMFGRAPGESLFESDSHLGDKPNALVLTVIPDHDDKRVQVEFKAGATQLDGLATEQTQRFISKLAGNAAWLAKQGAPLPQVHITVESLPDELGAREQRSAAVVQELRKHAAALGLDVGTMPVVIDHRVRDVAALRAQRSEFGFDEDEPIRTVVRVHAQLSGPGAEKLDPTPPELTSRELAELARTTGLHRAPTPLGKHLGKHTEVTTEEIGRMREIVRIARQLDPVRGDDPAWLTSVRRISDLQQRSGVADLDALVRQVFGLAGDAEVHPRDRRLLVDLVPHAKRSGRQVTLSDLIKAWPTPVPPPEPVPNEIAFAGPREARYDAQAEPTPKPSMVTFSSAAAGQASATQPVADSSIATQQESAPNTDSAEPSTSDASEPGWVVGRNVDTGEEVRFDPGEVQSWELKDSNGDLIGITFHSDADKREDIQTWTEIGGTADKVNYSSPLSEDAVQGMSEEEWEASAKKPVPLPWDSSLGPGQNPITINAHATATTVEVTWTDGTTVAVGGEAFAKIVAKPAIFKTLCEQQSGAASYQLLACESGKLNKPGGSAFDFQQALSKLGHGGTVFAPTGVLFIEFKPGPSSPFTVVLSNGGWAEFDGQVPVGTSANEPAGFVQDGTNVGGWEAEESDTTRTFDSTEDPFNVPGETVVGDDEMDER
ncbi:hypothetical protein AB0H34_38540 [Saccharopolyspora shandongensis]|uniref:scabin-related ADP-ribosyltransferase n=1 Tax=Saccharopolyspora shandongensis TaxID=418495 RepID=UPI0033FE0152